MKRPSTSRHGWKRGASSYPQATTGRMAPISPFLETGNVLVTAKGPP